MYAQQPRLLLPVPALREYLSITTPSIRLAFFTFPTLHVCGSLVVPGVRNIAIALRHSTSTVLGSEIRLPVHRSRL